MYEKYSLLLEKVNKTSYQISKETGISQTAFSNWKSGRSEPSLESLMSVIIELERGHCIEQMEARQIARKAVSTILSELPEELQTGDVVTYILKEAKMTAKCAKIKL